MAVPVGTHLFGEVTVVLQANTEPGRRSAEAPDSIAESSDGVKA